MCCRNGTHPSRGYLEGTTSWCVIELGRGPQPVLMLSGTKAQGNRNLNLVALLTWSVTKCRWSRRAFYRALCSGFRHHYFPPRHLQVGWWRLPWKNGWTRFYLSTAWCSRKTKKRILSLSPTQRQHTTLRLEMPVKDYNPRIFTNLHFNLQVRTVRCATTPYVTNASQNSACCPTVFSSCSSSTHRPHASVAKQHHAPM